MATTQKAIDIAQRIYDELVVRYPSLTVSLNTHTDGHPYILLNDGTPATTEFAAVIKVRPMEWSLAKDVLGNTAQIYVPTVIQLCTEENASGGAVPVDATAATLLPLLGVLLNKGCVFEWYCNTAGDDPEIGDITGANLKASFKDLFWDFKKAQ